MEFNGFHHPVYFHTQNRKSYKGNLIQGWPLSSLPGSVVNLAQWQVYSLVHDFHRRLHLPWGDDLKGLQKCYLCLKWLQTLHFINPGDNLSLFIPPISHVATPSFKKIGSPWYLTSLVTRKKKKISILFFWLKHHFWLLSKVQELPNVGLYFSIFLAIILSHFMISCNSHL